MTSLWPPQCCFQLPTTLSCKQQEHRHPGTACTMEETKQGGTRGNDWVAPVVGGRGAQWGQTRRGPEFVCPLSPASRAGPWRFPGALQL